MGTYGGGSFMKHRLHAKYLYLLGAMFVLMFAFTVSAEADVKQTAMQASGIPIAWTAPTTSSTVLSYTISSGTNSSSCTGALGSFFGGGFFLALGSAFSASFFFIYSSFFLSFSFIFSNNSSKGKSLYFSLMLFNVKFSRNSALGRIGGRFNV